MLLDRRTRSHLREQTDRKYAAAKRKARVALAQAMLDVMPISLAIQRALCGLSQLQLADLLGITPKEAFDFENLKAPVPGYLVPLYAITINVSNEFILANSKEC